MTDPIWMSVATALATKAAGSLFDLVKKRFSKDPERMRALESASGAAPDSAEVGTLAEVLAATERQHPGFAAELRAAMTKVDVRNVVGPVTGNVVQIAGDMTGDLNMGR